MQVIQTNMGTASTGRKVTGVTISNARGMSFSAISYGATITKVSVPDKRGAAANVVLGYETLQEYERGTAYLGCMVGRFANRIGGARFVLGGKEYSLVKNEAANHLHGGTRGFDKMVWSATVVRRRSAAGCPLHLHQPRRRRGLPGPSQGDGGLRPHGGQQAFLRVLGGHRRLDPDQPHQPHLLEPRRVRDGARAGARVQLPVLPSHRYRPDPDGGGVAHGGNAAGLLHAQGNRPRHCQPSASGTTTASCWARGTTRWGTPAPRATPPRGGRSSCGPRSPPSSSIRATTWTAGRFRGTARSAWRRSISPTARTRAGSRPASSCRTRSYHQLTVHTFGA